MSLPPEASGRWSPRRGEVCLLRLGSTVGSEIRKTRPCVVTSDDALAAMQTRTVVPIRDRSPEHERRSWCVPLDPGRLNGLAKPSSADRLHVRCASLERFLDRLGRLSVPELHRVVDGVCVTIQAWEGDGEWSP